VGFVYVDIVVRGTRSSRRVKMLVDTSSTYLVLKPNLVEELGLYRTPYAVELTLADGRKVEAVLYLAEVEVKGRGAGFRSRNRHACATAGRLRP